MSKNIVHHSSKIFVALLIAVGSFAVAPSATAAPTTFTVNVTTDESDANAGDGTCETANTGECTLRAAIEEANANVGADTIEFNIPDGGVQTIGIGSQLQASEQVTINGYSQPGAQVNTNPSPQPMNSVITVELRWNGSSTDALLNIDSPATNSEVRGLAINGANTAIHAAAAGAVIAGNYINTDATGLVAPDLGSTTRSISGVNIDGSGAPITLGGTSPADRNIITNSDLQGLSVSVGSHDTNIYGNYIGVGKDGVTDLGSINGIQISDGGGTIVIGGTSAGMRNVISGFSNSGVLFLANDSVLQGNYIGTDHTGNVNDSITSSVGVIFAFNSSGNLVGGSNPGEGNVIRGTSGAGITAIGMNLIEYEMLMGPDKNAILGNVISDVGIFDYENFGDSNLGIDHFIGNIPTGYYPPTSYDTQGPTANDDGDSDTGPNGLINTPELTSAVQVDDQLTITYDLDAAGSDSNEYRVEFFANDESTIFGHGPGQVFLGVDENVEPGDDNTVTLTVDDDYSNMALSATTTALDSTTNSGFGATSEFSQNIEIGTASDFDADGIADIVEDAAPNSGDGNDDGILDSLQATVSSYEIDTTYVTFVTEGCSANGSVSSLNESSIDATDEGFTYPFGLTDFTLNCSRGNTVNISKYVFTDTEADGLEVHKYRPNTETFELVEDATVEETTVGGENAIVMEYSIEDGGQYDDDGVANGVIVDPVGLAAVFTSSTPPVDNSDPTPTNSVTGTLATTGTNLDWQTPVIILELGLLLILLTLLPRKKFQHR